jgi:hypothetical protein
MWKKIKSLFKNSETIFLARIQVLAGTVVQVVATTEPQILAGLIGAQYLPWVLIGHGVLLEYLRRRGATDLK